MRYKITIITEQRIYAIKGVRQFAKDFNIECLKGLKEAKDGVELGIIVHPSNLLMMLEKIHVYYGYAAGEGPLTYNIELVPSVDRPAVVPFMQELVRTV